MRSDDQIRDHVLRLLQRYNGSTSGYIEGSNRERLIYDLSLELRVKKNYEENQIFEVINSMDK